MVMNRSLGFATGERLKSGIVGVETDDEEKKVNEMWMGWRINR